MVIKCIGKASKSEKNKAKKCIHIKRFLKTPTLFFLDSDDINESQHYDEESNPSEMKSEKDEKKPTSLCGWIKQIWSEIEGHHTFLFKLRKWNVRNGCVCVGVEIFYILKVEKVSKVVP